MSDEIGAAALGSGTGAPSRARHLAPMRVGNAVVFVEQVGAPSVVEADDAVYAVGAPSPEEAFETAAEALQECVRAVGGRFAALTAAARPQEVTVEFSLTFEAKGKALLPIFVTAETGLATGLKVTAVWRHPEPPKPE